MNDITKAVAESIDDVFGGYPKHVAEAFIAALKERGISLTWTKDIIQMGVDVGDPSGDKWAYRDADGYIKTMISAAADKE